MDTTTHYRYAPNEENMVHVVDHHGEYYHGKEHKRYDLCGCNDDHCSHGQTSAH